MYEITRDQLWKAILEDLFDDFLRWFYQPYLHQIDFKRPFEFLDQELRKIFPESVSGNRYVDKLVKVWLKDGSDSWFLLHVEAQSYPDPDFAERMYIYQYRIRDLHRRNITALAILADDNARYRPEAYQYEFMGTRLEYRFRVCKIMELSIAELEASENPFALALAAAWYGLRKNSRDDEQRLSFKIQLVRRLLNRQVKRERIRRLLEFIKFYAKFDRQEFYDHFEHIIQPNREKMGILELVEQEARKYYKKVGLEEGRAEGLEEGRAEGRLKGLQEAIEKLLRKGFSQEQIIDLLEVPAELVEQVRIAGTKNKAD